VERGASPRSGVLNVYLGIDSGSTTSKFALIDEKERVIERFYANNLGKPLDVLKQGLTAVHDKYKKKGVELKVHGLGTTGYGEIMTANAFGADYHIVGDRGSRPRRPALLPRPYVAWISTPRMWSVCSWVTRIASIADVSSPASVRRRRVSRAERPTSMSSGTPLPSDGRCSFPCSRWRGPSVSW